MKYKFLILFKINQLKSQHFTFLITYIFNVLRQDCATSITRVAREDSIDNKDNLDSVISVAKELVLIGITQKKSFIFLNLKLPGGGGGGKGPNL